MRSFRWSVSNSSDVTRGLSQGGQTLLKGAHWTLFGNAIISSQKFTYVTYIWAWTSEGGPRYPPWIFKISATKCCFLSFEWEKSNFTTFLHHNENDPCYGNSPKNALCWQQGFFSHRANNVTYCNQQSLSRCITCHRSLQQSHAAKHLLPQLEMNLCCHVTVTQWRPILELSAPKFRNLPLQEM